MLSPHPQIVETPPPFKAESVNIFSPYFLEQARGMTAGILELNSEAFALTARLKKEAREAGRDDFEKPPTLQTDNFGLYQRVDNKSNDLQPRYQSDFPDGPDVTLDFSTSRGRIDDSGSMELMRRVRVENTQTLNRTRIKREFQSEEGRVFIETRSTKLPLSEQYQEAIMQARSSTGRLISPTALSVSVTKWYRDEIPGEEKPEWNHEDLWDVRLQGGSGNNTQGDLAHVKVNTTKRTISVIPLSEWKTDESFYPSAEVIAELLLTLPRLIQLSGQFSLVHGEYGNKMPPSDKPTYMPVEFR